MRIVLGSFRNDRAPKQTSLLGLSKGLVVSIPNLQTASGFVAQLKRRVSYPYPRRTYAIATVSGVPSWVNRLSKAART